MQIATPIVHTVLMIELYRPKSMFPAPIFTNKTICEKYCNDNNDTMITFDKDEWLKEKSKTIIGPNSKIGGYQWAEQRLKMYMDFSK